MGQAILVAGFAVGTLTHARDVLLYGWAPERGAPLPVELYWTSLTVVDALTILLLFVRPRLGLWLAIAVMVSDVAVNSYAALTFFKGQFSLPALGVQVAFLLFLLVTAPWLMSGGDSSGFNRRRGNAWSRRRGGLGAGRGPFLG